MESLNNTKILENLRKEFILPTNEDYEGAILGIHRLEDTYLLSVNDIRNGKMSKHYQSRPLNALECFELGRIAVINYDNYHAIRWFNESLEQLKNEVDKPTVEEIDILDYYSFALAKQGNVKNVIDISKRVIEIEPNLDIIENNLELSLDVIKNLKSEIQNGAPLNSENNPFEFKNPPPKKDNFTSSSYEALCRGDNSAFNISNKRLSQLSCRYISYHPSLIIAPVKEEVVFDNPRIWLYHDVITEKQLNFMKEAAKTKLKRSGVVDEKEGSKTAKYRISQSGWLYDSSLPELVYLNRLVSAVTNLSLNVAEEWQIANYGIGGQYEPHFDYMERKGLEFEDNISSRVATWLFYLEAPEEGGSTVFSTVGILIFLFLKTLNQ
jgi:prolyl 4-hydroxylase